MISVQKRGLFKSKKANVLAALVAVVAILAGGLVYTQYSVTKQKQVNAQLVVNKVDLSTRQAISLGINDWIQSGFSYLSDVWYCNYPVPPALDEANPSLDSFANVRVNSYLSGLKQEHPEYSISN